jgi:hypothetical protein
VARDTNDGDDDDDDDDDEDNNNNNNNLAIMDLGHLLTRCGLTHPEIFQWSPLVPSAFWPVVF